MAKSSNAKVAEVVDIADLQKQRPPLTVDEYIEQGLVHEVHTSERKSFRACRRRWDWLFRQYYYPITTAKPLEFGVAYHCAMEVWYEPSTWKHDRAAIAQLAIDTFILKCEEQKMAALQDQGRSILDDDVEEDYAARVELGVGMLHYYFEKVSPQLDANLTPLRVEVGFMVPIRNPENGESAIWCNCEHCLLQWKAACPKAAFTGLPVVYAGRVDAIMQDSRGRIFVYDWKTASQIPQSHEFLELDDQVGSYTWALRKLGVDVVGFIYHEQRKAFPQEPQKNASRRLGRLFSVNKMQATDYDTYLQAIVRDDTDAFADGLYDDMLQFLQNEGVKYYERTTILKGREELAQIERNIGLEALDMTDENLRIYPAPGRFGCNTCAFFQPCVEANRQGDYQYALDTLYEKRTEHYYQRKAKERASTEGES